MASGLWRTRYSTDHRELIAHGLQKRTHDHHIVGIGVADIDFKTMWTELRECGADSLNGIAPHSLHWEKL